MAQITTTTRADVLQYPGRKSVDRSSADGRLWYCQINNAGTGVEFWRSSDNGGSWTLEVTYSPGATILELSSVFVDHIDRVYIAFRTNESSQDRIYMKAYEMQTSGLVQFPVVQAAAASNGGVAGAVYTGLDLTAIRSTSYAGWVVIAAGTTSGANHGVTLFGVRFPTSRIAPYSDNGIIATKRQWLHTGSGRITPQLQYELSPAHLWVVFGRTAIYAVKASWNGNGWTGPASDITIATGITAQDSMSARFNDQYLSMVVPSPTSTSTVQLYERNKANTATTIRPLTNTHPTGVVRNCACNVDATSDDVRVYAVGTSTTVLYYCDYIRSSNTWTSWTTVTATAILGATGTNYGTRRDTSGDSRYHVMTAHEAGANDTVVHTRQTIDYPPNVPTWNTSGKPYINGGAADVAASLLLDWDFTDPDPTDAQTAYAVSRQIGAGTLSYWRASDSTWQATEQKNLSATTQITLSASWAAASDANYTFKVKVWDGADVASVYSSGLILTPSAKVNPTLTAPGATTTSDTITATWTVSEQSAFRVRLEQSSNVVYDSGFISSSATSYQIPYTVTDTLAYTVRLETKNNEGLTSNQVTASTTIDFIEPMTPTLAVTTQTALGVLRVVITNPTPSGGAPALAYQDLWRRKVGDTSDGVRVAAGVASGGTVDDWRALSGVAYEYRSRAFGVNGTSKFSAWTA